MTRLCERPGCSERGAIAYGFDAGQLLVWLAPMEPDADRNRAGTLCVRHADSMVVPRGWTLEDARDPMPRLFRPAPRQRVPRASRRADSRKAERAPAEQPPLDNLAAADAAIAATAAAEASTVVAVTGVASGDVDPDATTPMPWMPEFDITDDLGGTLNADSPLLSRAFRGIGRPQP
jgi:hypothetical protein